jgi:hypothetical protein
MGIISQVTGNTIWFENNRPVQDCVLAGGPLVHVINPPDFRVQFSQESPWFMAELAVNLFMSRFPPGINIGFNQMTGAAK